MAYIPYGYKIQDGVVTVDEKAAGQVKVFFEKYISGLSPYSGWRTGRY